MLQSYSKRAEVQSVNFIFSKYSFMRAEDFHKASRADMTPYYICGPAVLHFPTLMPKNNFHQIERKILPFQILFVFLRTIKK